MNLHLNTLQVSGLEKGIPYTFYYIAKDSDGRITQVYKISIPGQADTDTGQPQGANAIKNVSAFQNITDFHKEDTWFEVELEQPTKEPLELGSFAFACSLGGLTLGRVETQDNQYYTVYMKTGYYPLSNNTYTCSITLADGSIIKKSFYLDLAAPILTMQEISWTSKDEVTLSFRTDEPGTAYYKILDEIEDTGKYFCIAAEDVNGNRTAYYSYRAIPTYAEPDIPEED